MMQKIDISEYGGPEVMALKTGPIPVPVGLTMEEAAALPETFFTVWVNVFERGDIKPMIAARFPLKKCGRSAQIDGNRHTYRQDYSARVKS